MRLNWCVSLYRNKIRYHTIPSWCECGFDKNLWSCWYFVSFTPGLNWDVIWDFPRSGVDNSEEVYDLDQVENWWQVHWYTLLPVSLSLDGPFGRHLPQHCTQYCRNQGWKNNSLTSERRILAIWAIRAGINLVLTMKSRKSWWNHWWQLIFFANKSGKNCWFLYPSDPVLSIAAKSVILNQPDGKEKLFTNLKSFAIPGQSILAQWPNLFLRCFALAVDFADEYKNSFDAPITGLAANWIIHFTTSPRSKLMRIYSGIGTCSKPFVEFAKTYTVKSFEKLIRWWFHGKIWKYGYSLWWFIE